MRDVCNEMNEYIELHFNLEIAKNIDNSCHQFENNFFNSGIHLELDDSTKTINDSEEKLKVIQNYLSNLIKTKENSSKTSDFVKIHETEKNNYSLVLIAFTSSGPDTKTWKYLALDSSGVALIPGTGSCIKR